MARGGADLPICLPPHVEKVSGRTKDRCLRPDLLEQVEPEFTILTFELVEADVLSGDGGFYCREDDGLEAFRLVKRDDLIDRNEIAAKPAKRSVGGPRAALKQGPDFVAVSDPTS